MPSSITRAVRSGAQQQPRVGRQHVGLGLDAGAQVLALGGQPGVVQQPALDQRGGLRGPLLVAPAARRLGAGCGEPAAGGGVGDQRLEAVEVGVQQGGDVAVAAVLAQQRRRVPEVEQRLAGPAEVGVPGVERAPLGGQRVARLPQQPGQLGELGGVDRLLAQQPGQRRAGDVPRGPRRPARARRASRPAGSCARPATARSCRRSPSPRRPRPRPSARPARRSSDIRPGAQAERAERLVVLGREVHLRVQGLDRAMGAGDRAGLESGRGLIGADHAPHPSDARQGARRRRRRSLPRSGSSRLA